MQSTDQTNVDSSGLAAAARDDSVSIAAQYQQQSSSFVNGLGPTRTTGYVQPTATSEPRMADQNMMADMPMPMGGGESVSKCAMPMRGMEG